MRSAAKPARRAQACPSCDSHPTHVAPPQLDNGRDPHIQRLDLLRHALRSVLTQTVGPLAVVVVDNNSRDRIGERVSAEFPSVRLLRLRRNTFFARAVNRGAELASTPYLAVINDDVVLDQTWAAEALAPLIADPTVGSVASRVYQTGRELVISSAGDHLNPNGWAGNIGWGCLDDGTYSRPAEVFSASGACALYRTRAFHEAGGFDKHYTAYMEDVDLGFRMQLLGHRCVYIPSAIAYHIGGATSKSRRRALFLAERNMVWNIATNFPSSLLWRHRRALLRSLATPAPINGNARSTWLLGKLAAIATLPVVLVKRRSVQRRRCVPTPYLDALLRSRCVEECHL